MFRKIFFILSLFCLASMVFPMQVVELSISNDVCSEASASNSSCCDSTNSSCHNDNTNKDSMPDCKDHCQQCHTCHGCFMPIFLTADNHQAKLTKFDTDQKAFAFTDLLINTLFYNIWQPPKMV